MRAPVVSLRDEVLFPEQRMVLAIGRPRSLAALARGGPVLVLAQRSAAIDEPGPDDHVDMGCTAELVHVARRDDGGLDVTLRGLHRARVEALQIAGDALEATISTIDDDATEFDDALIRAYATQIAAAAWGIPLRAARRRMAALADAGRLADVVIGAARLPLDERRELLEETRPAARVGRVLADGKKWSFRVASPGPWLTRARQWLF